VGAVTRESVATGLALTGGVLAGVVVANALLVWLIQRAVRRADRRRGQG
jgi:hypothetical protein